MGLFKLFQEKKNFRLFLFVLLGLIAVSFGSCSLDYGFPTVYAHQSTEGGSKSLHFDNFLNLLINIIVMLIIFFAIEKIRKKVETKGNLKAFDISLFLIIMYLIVGFIFTIVEFYVRATSFTFFLYSGIWFAPAASLYWSTRFTENMDINFRICLLITSIVLFLILYYTLKSYYKIKSRKK